MRTREDQERWEEQWLAPYAMRAARSRGRRHPEPEHAYRTAFQRDRDRLIHCTAFRRLEYKTQVFVNHEGDYYRTRLTHTLEVSQIARTIARVLGLNEDLTEVIALAHDLGHTPFGHSGQEVMQELMADHGGFEHNLQSLRIVEMIERRYPSFPGLNLSWEVRESILKHETSRPDPLPDEYDPSCAPLAEARVVDLADAIAYDHHDIDDSLRMGLLPEEAFFECELWRRADDETAGAGAEDEEPAITRRRRIRHLINLAVTDVVEESSRRLAAAAADSPDAVRRAVQPLLGFSAAIEPLRHQLQQFLLDRVYSHPRVIRMQEKAKRILRALFEEFLRHPGQLPYRFQSWMRDVGPPRAICDYLAGMTDRYVHEEYRKLFDPMERI